MSRCLSGAYDATDVFVWHDYHDEQDGSSIDAEALNSLLAIVEPLVENFDLLRILQSARCSGETDSVLGEIGGCFGLVPFISQRCPYYRIPVLIVKLTRIGAERDCLHATRYSFAATIQSSSFTN